jgi:hypothetical protein
VHTGYFDGDLCHHHAAKAVGKKVERHDKAAMKHLVSVGHVPVHATGTSEWNMHLRRAIRKIRKENPKMSMDEVYVLAFERVKSHDHAPVLIGEFARQRASTEAAQAAKANKANGNITISAAGGLPPVSEDGGYPMTPSPPMTPRKMDSDSNLIGAGDDAHLGPVAVVPVLRSVSSTSSVAPGVCRVGFPQTLYKCVEQDGKVLVPVKRRGNIHMPIQIGIKHRDATAVYGRDYSFDKDEASIILDFKSGEKIKEVALNIVNHDEYVTPFALPVP